jgi:chaperone required for assembly of F1-ATPase
MRELLDDLHSGRHVSDTDPMRRARFHMKQPLSKRFYEQVETGEEAGAFVVRLDGKTVRTPAKAPLALPTEAAARLVVEEFAAQGQTIDPATMPVYRLVNTAIDGVASDPQAVLEEILRFAASDLVCYRAGSPATLVRRESDAWDPVIDWSRRVLGARFMLAEGMVHVEQPRETIAVLGVHLKQRSDPLRLAALHVMTTLMGSALLALAVEAGEMDAEAAWSAAHVDEDYQSEQWGQDAEAVARSAARKRDMLAASRLIAAIN